MTDTILNSNTQAAKVARYLHAGRTLTAKEAAARFDIARAVVLAERAAGQKKGLVEIPNLFC